MRLSELLESISVAGNQLRFAQQHSPFSSTKSEISTYPERRTYKTHLPGVDQPVYSLFNYHGSPVTTKLLTSLKGKGPLEVRAVDLKNLINTAVTAAKPVVDVVKPETVIYPRSSSPLVKIFVDALADKYQLTSYEGFTKRALDKLKGRDLIDTSSPEWEKFSQEFPKDARELEQALDRQVKTGQLELKKLYKPFVRFVRNFMEPTDVSKLIDALVGKRVLVVDDVLSSGSTIRDMLRQASELEPKELAGLTIFKRADA